jgi:putative transcriptional regulator
MFQKVACGLLALCAADHVGGLRSRVLRTPRARSSRIRASDARGDAADDERGPAPAESDWRAVRARLVAQARAAQEPASAPAPTTGWVIETPLIEQGSVILASTEQQYGFGLSQQYFHKSVMLVLSHSDDFTRGIILNRPTPFLDDDGWPLWFGGDVMSLMNERGQREVTCVHTLRSAAAERLSVGVIPGVSYTSLACAQELVAQGVASPSDFWTFVGYAGWGPGQLQDELDRASGSSWRLCSADSGLLLRELIEQQRNGTDSDGIETWARLMGQLGHATSEVDASAGGFADRMLREWVRVNLRPMQPTRALTRAAVAAAARAAEGERSPVVLEPGSVLRSAAVVSTFTLGRQYMHKALLLLLRTGRQGSVAVLLNRPSAAHLAFPKSGRRRHVLFGGQLALRGENMIWLHSSPTLLGEPVGSSGVFKTSSDEAMRAIERGEAAESDFACVHGVLAWGAGGLESEVAAGHFVPVVDTTHVPWSAVWSLADPRSTQAMPAGVASAGGELWERVRAAEPAEILGGLEREVADGDVDLADTALLRWVDTFLS